MCVVSGDVCNGFLYLLYRKRSRETSSHPPEAPGHSAVQADARWVYVGVSG